MNNSSSAGRAAGASAVYRSACQQQPSLLGSGGSSKGSGSAWTLPVNSSGVGRALPARLAPRTSHGDSDCFGDKGYGSKTLSRQAESLRRRQLSETTATHVPGSPKQTQPACVRRATDVSADAELGLFGAPHGPLQQPAAGGYPPATRSLADLATWFDPQAAAADCGLGLGMLSQPAGLGRYHSAPVVPAARASEPAGIGRGAAAREMLGDALLPFGRIPSQLDLTLMDPGHGLGAAPSLFDLPIHEDDAAFLAELCGPLEGQSVAAPPAPQGPLGLKLTKSASLINLIDGALMSRRSSAPVASGHDRQGGRSVKRRR